MLRGQYGSIHAGAIGAILAGDFAGALALEAMAAATVSAERSVAASQEFARIQLDVAVGQLLDVRGSAIGHAQLEADGQSDDLHLLALATLAVPELEGMFRGGDDFAVAPLGHACPIDIRRPKKAFLESDGMTKLRQLGPAKVREVLARSLCDAGLESHDPKIRYIALPRLGGRTIKEMYIPAIAEVLKAEPLHLGDRTGHLGAGDFLANIADIIGLGLLGPGEIALVIGGGGGFTLSCAVLRAPEQARTRAG
jgi:3-oxoacyl-[acyl-carrier-protein] synthase-3